jgi:hypothetical protein
MQLRATRTFMATRYNQMIRAGQKFTAEPGYGRELIRGNKAELAPVTLQPPNAGPMQPPRTQVIKTPPRTKEKKEQPTEPPESDAPSTADPKTDGPEKPSLLSRAGRALRKKTPTTAGRAARP